MSREDKTTDTEQKPRPKRTPLGMRNRLTFNNLDPNYVYRIINDVGDRIERAKEGGYEFVTSDQMLGDAQVGSPSKIGAKVKKPVGGGITGHLMRIPKEFYDEDQREKMKKVDELEAAMKPEKAEGQYGEGLTKK